jgi:hypothetical protein
MLTRLQDINSNDVNELKPTNALYHVFLKPMPCEKKAAQKKNNSRRYMKENNIAGVFLAYSDSKRYQNNCLLEVIFCGIGATLLLGLMKFEDSIQLNSIRLIIVLNSLFNTPRINTRFQEAKNSEILFLALLSATLLYVIPTNYYITIILVAFLVGHMAPNVYNVLSYKETKNECDKWLSKKLKEQTLNQLRTLTWSTSGMDTMYQIFKNEKINSSSANIALVEILDINCQRS